LIVINISYKFIKASKGYFESIIQRVKRLILAISINFLENTRLKICKISCRVLCRPS